MNFSRRLRRLALATLATTLLAGSLAVPAAQASFASVDGNNNELDYTGSSEANNVVFSAVGSTYTITDSGATITPGLGCTSLGATKVFCTSSQISRVDATTNAGNDTVTVSGGIRSVVDGGAGDDRLVGGSSWDWLSGGTGDDTLDGRAGGDTLNGGDGFDTVDYSSRTATLKVSLNSSYWMGDDGETNEHDNVSTNVEAIVGGSGNDVITGNSANNTLDGGPGRDVLNGGDGADVLRARDGDADQVNCGSGSDAGEADAADAVNADCESVLLPAAGPIGNTPQTTLDFLPARVRVTHRGRLRLRIACPEAFGTCEGTVVITPLGKAQASASRRTSKVIGRGRYKVKSGETKIINVKLSRNGRRRVLRKKRLKCKASSVTRGVNGRNSTVRKKITLEAPRRKKS